MVHEFSGKWITSPAFADLTPLDVFHRQLDKKAITGQAPQNAHVLFRRKFTLRKTENTRIFLSADDLYRLYINGRFVCQGPAPGYHFHYYYNEADISQYLIPGENTIAVHTYYQGLINRGWVSGDDRHGLILDVEQDGNVILASGEDFLCAHHDGFTAIGEVGYHTGFMERCDSRSGFIGFQMPDFPDDTWQQACPRQHLDYTLHPQPCKSLVFETLRPTIIRDASGITADFGSTYVGRLLVTGQGHAGDLIELLYGQELNEDGSVRWKLRCNCDYREEWILSGSEDTFDVLDRKVFRYVRLNLPAGCEITDVAIEASHYPFALTAAPNTDDPELLRIWNLCVHSLRYGVQEVIQDCMDRERGNYLEDGCLAGLTYYRLTGDASVLKKLIDDTLRTDFITETLMTCAACSFMQEIAEYPLIMMHALLRYLELSGDKDYLDGHYPQLCRVLDAYRDEYAGPDGLLRNLDKWCVVEWPKVYRDGYDVNVKEGQVCQETHSVINAHYLGAITALNQIAVLLGKPPYRDTTALKEAFYGAFYVPDKKLFRDSIHTDHISMIANLYPFMYDICPEECCEEAIVEMIQEKGFTTVMLFGAYAILEGLRRTDRQELLTTCMKDPGAWLRMLREGATTMFEAWGKEAKWNTSLFHLTLSYVALFMAK